MLRDHRGLSVERRIKAIFWWRYMHSPDPLPAAEILRVMPTDRSIAAIYGRLDERQKLEGTIPRWGDAIVWSELHNSEPYRDGLGLVLTHFLSYNPPFSKRDAAF